MERIKSFFVRRYTELMHKFAEKRDADGIPWLIRVLGKNGVACGIIASIIVALPVMFIGRFLIFLVGNPTQNLELFGIGFNALLLIFVGGQIGYDFFMAGFHTLPTSHRGIHMLFGKREKGHGLYPEGWAWMWPSIGKIIQQDMQKFQMDRTLDGDEENVYAKDHIPVSLSVSATYQVGESYEEICAFIDYGEPVKKLHNELVDEGRNLAAQFDHNELSGKGEELNVKLTASLGNQMKTHGTGIRIVATQIGSFQLPSALEKAQLRVAIEEVEATSDVRDATTLKQQINLLIETGLSPDAAALAIGAARNEREVRSFTGLDGSIAGVAAAVAAAVQGVNASPTKPREGEPAPAPFGPGGRGSQTKKGN